MIVIDASAMVEALVGTTPDEELLALLTTEVHAPALLDVEVLSVLRGLELGDVITPETATQAVADYWALTVVLHETRLLSDRVWSLRHQFTSYDACYLALAEGLDAPLITCDRKMAARGHSAAVTVIDETR